MSHFMPRGLMLQIMSGLNRMMLTLGALGTEFALGARFAFRRPGFALFGPRPMFRTGFTLGKTAPFTATATPAPAAGSFALTFFAIALFRRRLSVEGASRFSLPGYSRRKDLTGFNGPLDFQAQIGFLDVNARAGNHLFQSIRVFFLFQEEIGNVKERITVQPYADKCRLHAGQHAGHTALVDGTGERVLIFAFEIDFS